MTPTALSAERAFVATDTLGESPVYDAPADALWWVDIRERKLQRLDLGSGRHEHWAAPDLCCGVALVEDGVVVALGRSIARMVDGVFAPLLSIDEPATHRLNEIRVGPDRALWVGSMVDFAHSVGGALYRIGRDGAVRRMLGGVGVPNSLGWSPDGTRLYFADTLDGRIFSYALDGDALVDPRVLVEASALPGRADGCAIDAAGGLWSARLGAGCVIRVDAHGGETHRIDLPPGAEPTACAFARDRLFITTARKAVADDAMRASEAAGAVFMARTNFAGLPEQRWDAPRHAASVVEAGR